MSRFPDKQSLNDDKNSMLWNYIFKYAVNKLDLRDRDGWVGWYSRTKEFLKDFLEEEENVASHRAKCSMAVWRHGLAATL